MILSQNAENNSAVTALYFLLNVTSFACLLDDTGLQNSNPGLFDSTSVLCLDYREFKVQRRDGNKNVS